MIDFIKNQFQLISEFYFVIICISFTDMKTVGSRELGVRSRELGVLINNNPEDSI